MKKLLLCLLSLVCVVCLFTACNKDTKYKITFQDLSVLPEGVERIQNGRAILLYFVQLRIAKVKRLHKPWTSST